MGSALRRSPSIKRERESSPVTDGSLALSSSALDDDLAPGFGNSDRLALLADARASSPTKPAADALFDAHGGLPFQEEMEASFEQDFSSVQVALGVSGMEDGLGARALARGEQLAFADASPDKETVAHELAHVVQARGASGSGTDTTTSRPGDATERDAERAADSVLGGEKPEIEQSATSGLQGSWLDDGVDKLKELVGLGEEDPEAPQKELPPELQRLFEKDELVARNFLPSTGLGCFDAIYRPLAGSLVIELGVCFQFQDGDPKDTDWQDEEGVSPDTYKGMRSPFTWDPKQAEHWKASAIQDLQDFWSARYRFHCVKPDFDLLPDVEVRLVVTETEASDAHVVLNLPHFPSEGNFRDYYTRPEGQEQGEIRLAETSGESPDVAENAYSTEAFAEMTADATMRKALETIDAANPAEVYFARGSAEVEEDDRAALGRFGATLGTFKIEGMDLTLQGESSNDGSLKQNDEIAMERARAAGKAIKAGGYAGPISHESLGEQGRGASHRCVGIYTEHIFHQETLIHEIGHALGLTDEYPEVDPAKGYNRPPGSRPEHQDLVDEIMNDVPGQDISSEVALDDSVMSAGMEVRAQHYVTFQEALETLSGIEAWTIGPGNGKGGARGVKPS